jgi:hypothetical protein
MPRILWAETCWDVICYSWFVSWSTTAAAQVSLWLLAHCRVRRDAPDRHRRKGNVSIQTTDLKKSLRCMFMTCHLLWSLDIVSSWRYKTQFRKKFLSLFGSTMVGFEVPETIGKAALCEPGSLDPVVPWCQFYKLGWMMMASQVGIL